MIFSQKSGSRVLSPEDKIRNCHWVSLFCSLTSSKDRINISQQLSYKGIATLYSRNGLLPWIVYIELLWLYVWSKWILSILYISDFWIYSFFRVLYVFIIRGFSICKCPMLLCPHFSAYCQYSIVIPWCLFQDLTLFYLSCFSDMATSLFCHLVASFALRFDWAVSRAIFASIRFNFEIPVVQRCDKFSFLHIITFFIYFSKSSWNWEIARIGPCTKLFNQ